MWFFQYCSGTEVDQFCVTSYQVDHDIFVLKNESWILVQFSYYEISLVILVSIQKIRQPNVNFPKWEKKRVRRRLLSAIFTGFHKKRSYCQQWDVTTHNTCNWTSVQQFNRWDNFQVTFFVHDTQKSWQSRLLHPPHSASLTPEKVLTFKSRCKTRFCEHSCSVWAICRNKNRAIWNCTSLLTPLFILFFIW